MKQRLLTLIGLSLLSLTTFAQSIKVTGVVSEGGSPLPGVNVVLKGSIIRA